MANQSDLDVSTIDPNPGDYDSETLRHFNQTFIDNYDGLVASLSNMIPEHHMKDVVQFAYLLCLHRGPDKVHSSMKNWIYKVVQTCGIKWKTEKYRGGFSQYCSLESDTEDSANLLDAMSEHSNHRNVPKASPEAENWEPHKSPEEMAIEKERKEERKELANDVFGQLPEKEQRPILECVILDKTQTDFAYENNLSTTTVNSRIKRGMEKMRGELKKKGLNG